MNTCRTTVHHSQQRSQERLEEAVGPVRDRADTAIGAGGQTQCLSSLGHPTHFPRALCYMVYRHIDVEQH